MNTKIFWNRNTIPDKLWKELKFINSYGSPINIKSEIESQIDCLSRDDKKGVYVKYGAIKYRDADEYMIIPMGIDIKEAIGILKELGTAYSGKFISGVVLEEDKDNYIEWDERREWYSQFLDQFRKTFVSYPIKIDIYVEIVDIGAINELNGYVDGILINPFQAISMNTNKISSIDGSFINIDRESENIEEKIYTVAKCLNIDLKSDIINGENSIDKVIYLIQLELFDYVIKRDTHVKKGGTIENFTYNGNNNVDEASIYRMAIEDMILTNDKYKSNIVQTEQSIIKAVMQKDSKAFLNMLAQPYSQLLQRVMLGTGLDKNNIKFNKQVSKDWETLLKYGLEIAKLIEDKKTNEMVIKIKQLQVEVSQEKIRNSSKSLPNKASDKLLGILNSMPSEKLKELNSSNNGQ